MSRAEQLSVVSIPSAHPYVEAVTDRTRVRLIAPETPPEHAWSPSPMLDAEWVRAHADSFDLVHVHFGFEPFTRQHLERFVAALAELDKPLIVTAHDLENPQLSAAEQEEYAEKLAVLVRAADRVVTLTDSAAKALEAMTGVRAIVVMHPPQLPLDAPTPTRPHRPRGDLGEASEPRVVRRLGVLMKDARPSLDLDALAPTAEATAQLGGVELEVLHHERFRAGREAQAVRTLEALTAHPHVHTRVTGRLSDADLVAWIARLDLLVLPYAHGTHSGLLELANEVGTRALVPPVGHFASQHVGVNAVASFTETAELRDAIAQVLAAPQLAPMTRAARHEALAAAQWEHLQLYRRVLRARETRVHVESALRVLIVAPFRHRIGQPHHGGLEAYVWAQVHELRARGHRVTLAAPTGSDFVDEDADSPFAYPRFTWPPGIARDDTSLPPGVEAIELQAMRDVWRHVAERPDAFDVVHNHTLHAEAFAWAPRITRHTTLVTTLHTPPIDEMLAAIAVCPSPGAFIGVSPHTTAAWRRAGVDSRTIANAVDTAEWTYGRGGDRLIWFGRLVPEKAPHLAMAVAERLGVDLVVAGPASEPEYARRVLRAAGERVRWVGPKRQRELAALVAESAVTLVTPVWDEPFGLVVAESLACGTPVVALRRGGLGEVFASMPGVRLVDPGDDETETIARLAAVTRQALDTAADPIEGPRARAEARRSAVNLFSLEHHLDLLTDLYRGEVTDA